MKIGLSLDYEKEFFRICSSVESFLYKVAVYNNNVDEEGDFRLAFTIRREDVEIYFPKGSKTPLWVTKPSWTPYDHVTVEDEMRLFAAFLEEGV